MTEDELGELLRNCPRLYHMAERGAWNGINQHGLLSTAALLDLYKVSGEERAAIFSKRRPKTVNITRNGLPVANVRDQFPMDDNGLRRALPDNISPKDWYEFLNQKVFFWLSEERLHRLSSAKAYCNGEREVLVLDSQKLVDAHHEQITLCPINSGCTKPFPHPRDYSAFATIPDYPYQHWQKKRRKKEPVVELCVEYSVPNVIDFIIDAYVIQGNKRISTL